MEGKPSQACAKGGASATNQQKARKLSPRWNPKLLLEAEQMFTEYVDQLLKGYLSSATWLNDAVVNAFSKWVCDCDSQATWSNQLAT